jgi:hypothetical protein
MRARSVLMSEYEMFSIHLRWVESGVRAMNFAHQSTPSGANAVPSRLAMRSRVETSATTMGLTG